MQVVPRPIFLLTWQCSLIAGDTNFICQISESLTLRKELHIDMTLCIKNGSLGEVFVSLLIKFVRVMQCILYFVQRGAFVDAAVLGSTPRWVFGLRRLVASVGSP